MSTTDAHFVQTILERRVAFPGWSVRCSCGEELASRATLRAALEVHAAHAAAAGADEPAAASTGAAGAVLYCECESPVMDPEHDAGCRRCGRPVDFSPAPPAEELEPLMPIPSAAELEELHARVWGLMEAIDDPRNVPDRFEGTAGGLLADCDAARLREAASSLHRLMLWRRHPSVSPESYLAAELPEAPAPAELEAPHPFGLEGAEAAEFSPAVEPRTPARWVHVCRRCGNIVRISVHELAADERWRCAQCEGEELVSFANDAEATAFADVMTRSWRSR